MNCKICNSRTDLFASAIIMSKYDINYYRCSYCGFIQTEKPFWLKEAYEEAINNTDIGLVSRNIHYSKKVKIVASLFLKDNANPVFVDYGGGYGLFVRLMRDMGFNFYRYEPFCDNLFAKGFDYDFENRSNNKIDLITAFEIFEHLAEPLVEIDKMMIHTNNIFFSTQLIPKNNPPMPGAWLYYGLEHGQHISFYTSQSLEIIAEKYNINYYSDKISDHLFSKKKGLAGLFSILPNSRVVGLLSRLIKRKSLIAEDYRWALKQLK